MEGSVRSLLEAERESQQIIQEAVASKSKRVGDANNDAQQELNLNLREFNEKFTLEEDRVSNMRQYLWSADTYIFPFINTPSHFIYPYVPASPKA